MGFERRGALGACQAISSVLVTLGTDGPELKAARLQRGDHLIDGVHRVLSIRARILMMTVMDDDDIAG